MKERARSQADKAIRKRHLLDAAKTLFSEFGYQGTTIEMISERASVSAGTFYLYFKNKPTIYRALYAEGLDLLLERVRAAVSWPGMNAMAKLTAIANAYLTFFNDCRAYYDIIAVLHLNQKDFFSSEALLETLDEKAFALLTVIRKVIDDGLASGEIVTADAWLATNFLWGMMDGLMLLEKRGNTQRMGTTLENLVKHGLGIVFHGLAAQSPSKEE